MEEWERPEFGKKTMQYYGACARKKLHCGVKKRRSALSWKLIGVRQGYKLSPMLGKSLTPLIACWLALICNVQYAVCPSVFSPFSTISIFINVAYQGKYNRFFVGRGIFKLNYTCPHLVFPIAVLLVLTDGICIRFFPFSFLDEDEGSPFSEPSGMREKSGVTALLLTGASFRALLMLW